jgi:hypothetical protein
VRPPAASQSSLQTRGYDDAIFQRKQPRGWRPTSVAVADALFRRFRGLGLGSAASGVTSVACRLRSGPFAGHAAFPAHDALFSFSIIFAARSAKVLGAATANLARISLATVLLASWAHTFGAGLSGAGLPWFFLSGVVGLWAGRPGSFGALPRIGPRLAILLTQCLAAPLAAALEWGLARHHTWRAGSRLRGRDPRGCRGRACAGSWITSAARGILGGSALRHRLRSGQACGAVLSRKADAVGTLAGMVVDGGTAAYQRIIGGALVTAIAFLCTRKLRAPAAALEPRRWQRGWPLVVANALFGPTIGVSCYQWALLTTPSGIVLPLVATRRRSSRFSRLGRRFRAAHAACNRWWPRRSRWGDRVESRRIVAQGCNATGTTALPRGRRERARELEDCPSAAAARVETLVSRFRYFSRVAEGTP